MGKKQFELRQVGLRANLGARIKGERHLSKTLSITDVLKDPKKSFRERALEMKEELKDKVRRNAQTPARNRNRKAATGEVLYLYFEPEICDEMLQFDNPLQESRDLLTSIVAHAPFQGMDPPEGNPEIGETVARTFDDRGNLIRHEHKDLDPDPGDPPRFLIQCQYDGDNNLIAKTVHYQGRLWDPVYRATYIGPGMPDEETYEADFNNDGVIEWRSTIRNTYDERARYVRGVSDWDDNADGTTESRSIEFVSYDSSGFRSRVVGEADDEADGDTDGRFTRFANRGLRGRLESVGEEWDFDLDGIVDLSDTFINFYDDRGDWIRELHDVDVDGRPNGWADGIPDSRTDTRFLTYDSRGNFTSSLTEYWFEAPFTSPDMYFRGAFEYDQHNQLTRGVFTGDTDADGDVDEMHMFALYYDRHGRMIESVAQFGGADPAYGGVERYRFAFDLRGNIVEQITNFYRADRPSEAEGYQGRMKYEQLRHQ